MTATEQFASLPLLESCTFPYALMLAYDVQEVEEGTERLLLAICDFLSACLLNYDWAARKIIHEDSCITPSMLTSAFHRLDMEPEKLLTLLALVFKEEPNNHLNTLVQKFKVQLLEMALRSLTDNQVFCSAFFKYIHRVGNDVFIVDQWDCRLVRDLVKRLLNAKDKDKSSLSQMLLVSSIAQEVMQEEIQTLVKIGRAHV